MARPDALSARLRLAVQNEAPGITPFSFLAEPATPAEQLRCARTWGAHETRRERSAASAILAVRRTKPDRGGSHQGRVRVFRFQQPPTALLIVELLERLRASALLTVGFATSASDGGALRKRIAAGFHEFHQVHDLPFEGIAARIAAADIDVLIDLRGYGGRRGHGRVRVATRADQVNGSRIPEPGRGVHRLPDRGRARGSTQRARALLGGDRELAELFPALRHDALVASRRRAETCGLPAHGIVFASFNNSYKISPDTFACWMRILRELAGSVLCCSRARRGCERRESARARAHRRAGPGTPRLHAQAAARRIPRAIRSRRPVPRHLAVTTRTTTASDACGRVARADPAGRTFASRVASSLLRNLRWRSSSRQTRTTTFPPPSAWRTSRGDSRRRERGSPSCGMPPAIRHGALRTRFRLGNDDDGGTQPTAASRLRISPLCRTVGAASAATLLVAAEAAPKIDCRFGR